MSQVNRCMPASADSGVSGRNQYNGMLMVAGSGLNASSVLEYRRTSLPSPPSISSVTGPVAADFR